MRGKPFEKGHKGFKPKGAENKVTQDARILFKQTLEAQVPSLLQAFEDVRAKNPDRFLELFAKYAQYFIPKQVDVTSKGEEVKQVFKIGNIEIEL
jgi:hypothetical protein